MLRAPTLQSRGSAYAMALALVFLGFAARTALTPAFGVNHAYTTFYPIVLLADYFLGAGPATMAALLSAGLGYWFFAAPEEALKDDFTTLASVMFFGVTAGVSIYFITGMRRALGELAVARGRAEDLARSHAELFSELNERVTNHLQLVAALLQVQARDETDHSMSRALAEASARTMLISRVHRNVAGEADKTLDFDAFAQQLLDAALAARGHPPVQVRIEAQGVRLPVHQATSVALVLLEWLNARLQLNTPADVRVRLRGDDLETTLEVSEEADGVNALTGQDLKRRTIEAMVEQLGGRFTFTADAFRSVSALVFPNQEGAAMLDSSGPRTLH